MDIIKVFHDKAKADKQRIVLPESEDVRVVKASQLIAEQGLADVVLVGKTELINQMADENSVNLNKVEIVDPEKSNKLDFYASKLQEKRAKKGMTIEQARETLLSNSLFFGAMMVGMDDADGMVAGALNTTANTLRSIIYCVGTAPECSIISSFFVMVVPDKSFGDDGVLFFSDCGVNPDPNAAQLAEIAISTAGSYKALIGKQPKVGMLSFSTKGSASHPDVDKVVEATKIASEKSPELLIDGELQADAALVPSVASKKAPGSKINGSANVLVFPDLSAGNIGYKLVQRLAGAVALGPVIQGAAKPVNDLSRGCSVQDIVDVAAITAVQAQAK